MYIVFHDNKSKCFIRLFVDDVMNMVGCRQFVCHGDTKDFQRRDSDNSSHFWWRCGLTLPLSVNKDDFFRFRPRERVESKMTPRFRAEEVGVMMALDGMRRVGSDILES